MSSATAANDDGADSSPRPTSAGGGCSGPQDSTTYWCHACDMGVSLVPSPPPLACPHCRGDFLEEMEDLPPRRDFDNPDEFGRRGDFDDLIGFSLRNAPLGESSSSAATAEDYYEVFDRLISHVVSSSPDPINDDNPSFNVGPRPASRSAVEAIPTVQITAAFLAADPSLLCAVCKDEFAPLTEAKQLPCSHIYHEDCILPWLFHHDSCPVCRFRLPADDEDRGRRRPAAVNRSGVVFGNLIGEERDEERNEEVERDVREIHSMLRSVFPGRMAEEADEVVDGDGDFLGIGGILRRLARRRRLSLTRRTRGMPAEDMAATSATRLVRAEMGAEGNENSTETPSMWPLDEGTTVRGGGGVGGRADEEGDVGMGDVGRLYN